MPEKDGADDKKTTKEVVNKKQKQMMGEEGYDHLRDQGRIRKNKKKKDATTMPPSKEMEKTRKVNKGPSALERVKKKYKGQIMDVKKEELDLTQVAEAFGGYIIEKDEFVSFFDGSDTPNSKPKVTTGKGKEIKTTQKPKRVTNRMAKTMAGQDIEKETGEKFVKGPNLQNLNRKTRKPKNVPLTDDPSQVGRASKVISYNPRKGEKPPESKIKPVKKITPPATDKSFISGDSKASKERSIKMVGKPTGDMDAETYKVKKPKRQYYKATKKSRKATPKELERTRAQVAKAHEKEMSKMYKSPETGRMTRRTKSYRDTSIGLADRRIKVAAQKTKQFAARSAQSVATKVRSKPGSAAALGLLAVGTAADVIRGLPKIPTPPKVRGGTVGRRTAG